MYSKTQLGGHSYKRQRITLRTGSLIGLYEEKCIREVCKRKEIIFRRGTFIDLYREASIMDTYIRMAEKSKEHSYRRA